MWRASLILRNRTEQLSSSVADSHQAHRGSDEDGSPDPGNAAEDVDAAEDRELFDEILEQCQIPRAKGQTVFTAEEAKKAANELGYPVLVRPSYVLGGQVCRSRSAMRISTNSSASSTGSPGASDLS